MGTRGFTGWKIDGKLTIVYQQCDSYPSYTGHKVATDLRAIQERIATALLYEIPGLKRDVRALTEAVRSALRAEFKGIRRLTDRTRITPALVAKLAPVTGERVSTGADVWSLTRNLQGDLAAMVEHKIAYHYGDDWPRESLFCEWGYLLNFDADEGLGRVEVYRGFQQQSPTAGEWAGSPAPLEDQYEWTQRYNPKTGLMEHKRKTVGKAPSEYFPVNLVRWFSLVPPPTPEQVAAVEEQVYRTESPEDYAADVVAELAADGITATVKQITG